MSPPISKQRVQQIESRGLRKIREGFDRLEKFRELFYPTTTEEVG